MSYKVKQLGNKYICVGPGNKRLPETFRSRRQAMNHLMSLGAAKGDLVRTDDIPQGIQGASVDFIVMDELADIPNETLDSLSLTKEPESTEDKEELPKSISKPSPKYKAKSRNKKTNKG